MPRSPAPLGSRDVLLDANALFLPFRTSLSLEQEVERLLPGAKILVPSSVVEELGRLQARNVPLAHAARELAERFPRVNVERSGDAGILEAALARGASVVTADRALALRLRARGVRVLRPRDRARLEQTERLARRSRPGAERTADRPRRPGQSHARAKR